MSRQTSLVSVAHALPLLAYISAEAIFGCGQFKHKVGNGMAMRIYIHAPDLPNSKLSRNYIDERIARSEVKAELIVNKPDPLHYEYPTLHKLWKDAQRDEFYALYIHLKGSSKTNAREFENARCWMDYMLYGVVDNWRICKSHLDGGADVVGSQWHWHFKGNFWWAKSSYLRTLPDPLLLSSDRFAAEYWCCWGFWRSGFRKPAVKNLFYIEGVNRDDMYTLAHRVNFPPNLNRSWNFVDSEVDGMYGQNVDGFLERKYYCALDSIVIPTSRVNLLVRLADFLNYDGNIFIGDNLYDLVRKPWKELVKNI